MTARRQPDGTGAHRIVRAGEADIKALSQVIADAFFPLAPCRWLISDEAARRDIFPAYFRLYVEHAMAGGIVHTTPARDAAALWIPVGPQLPGPPCGYGERLVQITGPWAGRFHAFDAELDAHHLTGIEHHHLAILAVRPDRQGRGIGTALLDTHHAVLDQRDIAAYLEASDESTRGIYLRHGYADHGIPIHLDDGLVASGGDSGPSQSCGNITHMYPMVRRPRPVARSQPLRLTPGDRSAGENPARSR
jgi:GNAT superfamily N-acetyltransferase